LHFHDIAKLLDVLHELTDQGKNSHTGRYLREFLQRRPLAKDKQAAEQLAGQFKVTNSEDLRTGNAFLPGRRTSPAQDQAATPLTTRQFVVRCSKKSETLHNSSLGPSQRTG
jgi:hypothetical protein